MADGGAGVERVMSVCDCDRDIAVSLLAATDGGVELAVAQFFSAAEDEQNVKEGARKKLERQARKRARPPDAVNAAGRVVDGPPPRRSARPDCDLRTQDSRWQGWQLQSTNLWDAHFAAARGPPLRIASHFRAVSPEWRGAAAVLEHLRKGEATRRWLPSQVQVQVSERHTARPTLQCRKKQRVTYGLESLQGLGSVSVSEAAVDMAWV